MADRLIYEPLTGQFLAPDSAQDFLERFDGFLADWETLSPFDSQRDVTNLQEGQAKLLYAQKLVRDHVTNSSAHSGRVNPELREWEQVLTGVYTRQMQVTALIHAEQQPGNSLFDFF